MRGWDVLLNWAKGGGVSRFAADQVGSNCPA